MDAPNTRRDFLKKAGILGGAAIAAYGINTTEQARADAPEDRAPNTRYMGGFAAERIETVRCAFIGVGQRGGSHARQFAKIPGTEIVAICDLHEDLAKRSAGSCRKNGRAGQHANIKLYHDGEDDWKKMLAQQKPDAVIIATPWRKHADMAIHTMRSNAHAFVEVPLAVTNQELWKIVNTSEETQRHCMMLENVNYGRDELMFLNMCRQGVIGELLYGEASYIHNLVKQMQHVDRGTGAWRTPHYAERNGNLYPTHGLGPVAQYMNLARGEDQFGTLVSYSSPAIGRQTHAENNFPQDHKWNQLTYRGGDMNTSIIQTTLGRTIMVQWDETSPRPYSRHNLVQGTQGCLAGFPTRVALDSGIDGVTADAHEWAEGEKLKSVYAQYEHPLYKRLGALAKEMGGHGGMDFIMRCRIVECLRQGQPLDQNVYEGAFWSAVAPLSEASVAQGGTPQPFPDFTRGEWKQTEPLGIVQ